MTKEIIQNGSPQAKKFIAYACKLAVVKSYPPALLLLVAKNPYTYFAYPKLFQRKQDIQNAHLKDWIEIANKQLITYKFNPISQDANFDRKVRIFKSQVQAEDSAMDKQRDKLKVSNKIII